MRSALFVFSASRLFLVRPSPLAVNAPSAIPERHVAGSRAYGRAGLRGLARSEVWAPQFAVVFSDFDLLGTQAAARIAEPAQGVGWLGRSTLAGFGGCLVLSLLLTPLAVLLALLLLQRRPAR